MTNTLFFSAINRDDTSVSTSSPSETSSEPPQRVAQASSSAYSVIGKAWLACARPQLEADEDVHSSTANTSAPAMYRKLKRISHMELQTATSEFHTSNILGSGEYGSVFKGWINENTLTATAAGKGIAVAVKRLHQGRAGPVTKWLKVINYAGRFHHPNLVRTLAYCTKGEQPMVVYEFMPQGSLADHLFLRNGGSGRTPPNWDNRMKIAISSARGLAHLHVAGKVVHGNIKSSNVLLHADLESCLSDYGLNPLFGTATPPNRVAGYHAPEVVETRKVTFKSDVYSFGVLLLELLTGKATDEAVEEGTDLPRWVQTVVREEWTLEVFDEALMGGCNNEEEMVQLLQMAMSCVSRVPDQRPSMQEVVRMIEEMNKTEIDDDLQ